jgi:CRP-like cAMP-binding protein
MLATDRDYNHFLAALPDETRTLFEARATTHSGGIGDILQPADAPIEAVWFPLSGLVSTLRPMPGDGMVEVDAAGNEGVLGVEVIWGEDTANDVWMVQSPGRFARLDVRVFTEAVNSSPEALATLRTYIAAVFALRGQWVACNGRHTIEQRLAKWLLITRDRINNDEIQITQDTIAMMLGVRRASVVTVLGRFVDDGMVAHGYARVRVVDNARLANVACGCYGVAARTLGEFVR